MNQTKKTLIIMLSLLAISAMILAVLPVFTICQPLYAAYAGETADIKYAKDDFDAINITVPFLDTATVSYEWEFPYADDFFRQPSERFSRTMAQGSLGLSASAFRSDKYDTIPLQYETYLRRAGFEDLMSFGFDAPTTEESLSGVIGKKKIDGFTVIAAVTCGQGYGNEWAGNLKVGNDEIHEGFRQAADLLESHLNDYIEANDIDRGDAKLWLSGISRAAAVANLTAADAIESGDWDDVYAYLFGVPRTTKKPEAYPGIYNICGQFDPVSQAPLQSWGYERYGTDLYTPSQEMNSDYPRMAKAASQVSRKLSGKPFRNNPELNHEIHLVLEYMGDFFPETSDYVERLQDILMKTWKDPTQDNIVEVVASVILQMDDLNKREKDASRALLGYVAMIAAQHTRANSRQVEDGSWDPDEPLAANMVLEHRPATYLVWLFSETDSKDLFTFRDATRWLSFSDNMDVDVYQGKNLLGSISSRGKVTYPEDGTDPKTGLPLPEPYMVDVGTELVMNLPEDKPYRLVLTVPERMKKKDGVAITCFDMHFSTEQLTGSQYYTHLSYVTPGTFRTRVAPGKPLGEIEAITGSVVEKFTALPIEYSPVQQMINESNSVDRTYLSIDTIMRLLFVIMITLGAIGSIHLILLVIYTWRRCHGSPPHPVWMGIVPYLFYIVVFMGLTLLMTYELFIMDKPRAICAAGAVFFVAILALRGSLHCRRPRNYLVTAALFVLSFLTFRYYGHVPQGAGFGIANVALYSLTMAVLCAIAIGTFYAGKSVEER